MNPENSMTEHENTQNNQANEYDVYAIDKQFWVGKTKISLNDIEKAHGDLVSLQDGLNRAIRHVNRKAQANFDAINRLANSVNLNSVTVEAQIQSLVERIDQFESNNGIVENDLNRSERMNDKLTRLNPFVDDNPEVINEINTLTGITGLEVFSQESVSAFDKWSRRFKDYMAVMSRNMNEQEKLDRLRLALDDTPRDLFVKLSAAEAATVDTALRALKEKLDSPQRKELAKRSLVLCKQREDETVSSFLKRLTSLVEVAYSNLGQEPLKERLCEEFLDRLKPDLSFLIRLAGLSKEKNLELVRTQAEELELLLKTHMGQQSGLFPQAVQAIDRNPQMPSSSGQFNNNQDVRQFRDQRGNQQKNNFSRKKASTPMQNEGQKRFRGGWNNNPNNERKWNSRPVCNFCKRTGYFAFNCFERRRQFNYNWKPEVNSVQDNTQSTSSNTGASSNISLDVNELFRAFSAMKLQQSGNKSNNESGTINSISHCIHEGSEHENKAKINQETENIQRNVGKGERPKISNWEGIGPKLTKFLMIIGILTMIAAPTIAEAVSYMPKHPMICQNVRNGVLWAIPMLKECPRISLDYSDPPTRKTLWLFAPNKFQQETSAWACRKIRKSLRKFTTLSNVNIKDPLEPEPLEMTIEE